MIEINHVNKWYVPSFQALRDCTTSAAQGEVQLVQDGEVIRGGIRVNDPKTDLPTLRARVGMVFQHFELFPHLRIIENLCLAQEKVLGRSHAEAVAKSEKLLQRRGVTAD